MKYVVVGAGVVGLNTAIRLKEQGHDVTVYDMRPADDADKLVNLLYLPAEITDTLPEVTKEYLFGGDKPRAVISEPYHAFSDGTEKTAVLGTSRKHTGIEIRDLVRGLQQAAESAGVEIKRGYKHLRNETVDGVTQAVFDHEGEQVTVGYDACVYAAGLKGALASKDMAPVIVRTADTIVASYEADNSVLYGVTDNAEESAKHPLMLLFPMNKNHPYFGGIVRAPGRTAVFRTVTEDEAASLAVLPNVAQSLCDGFIELFAKYAASGKFPHIGADSLGAVKSGLGKCKYASTTVATHSVNPSPFVADTNTFVLGDALLSKEYLWGSELTSHLGKVHEIFMKSAALASAGGIEAAGEMFATEFGGYVDGNDYAKVHLGMFGLPGSKDGDGNQLPKDYKSPTFAEIQKIKRGSTRLVQRDEVGGGALLVAAPVSDSEEQVFGTSVTSPRLPSPLPSPR